MKKEKKSKVEKHKDEPAAELATETIVAEPLIPRVPRRIQGKDRRGKRFMK